jgi:heterotetrameric sarcosine oxidase gamma subunit
MATKALARTPLHHWHAARNARFVERDGWQIPAAYGEVDREMAVVRAGLGLVDVSALAKISLHGASVATLAKAVVGESTASKPGGVSTFATGGRGLACCLTQDHLLLLAFTSSAAALRASLAAVRQEPAVVENDVSCAYAAFCLLGAAADNVLRPLTALDVGPVSMPAGSCAETNVGGVYSLLIRPPGMPRHSLYILVAWDLAESMWEWLLHAGQAHGVEPVGLDAWHRYAV